MPCNSIPCESNGTCRASMVSENAHCVCPVNNTGSRCAYRGWYFYLNCIYGPYWFYEPNYLV